MASIINASSTLGLISSADTSGVLQLQTANTAAVTIDASQNVGVGTASPTDTDGFGRVLDIRSASGGQVVIRDNDDTTKFARLAFDGGSTNAAYVGAEGSGTSVLFRAGAATRATLDSAGNLGLGVTPSAWATGLSLKAFQFSATGSVYNYSFSGNNFTAIADNTYLNSGGSGTYISTNTASQYRQTAGQHQWFSAPSGTAGNAISFTQAMSLFANGNWAVGTTTDSFSSGTGVFIRRASSTETYIGVNHSSGSASGADFIAFAYNGTQIGGVAQNGTTGVLYNITSDYRLKTVIGAVTGHGERIDALEPIEYEWKSDGSRTRGFLAHKFQEVYASSVSGEKDAVDADGNPVYQAMQASTPEVIADLVAEIQSLRQRLAVLEGK